MEWVKTMIPEAAREAWRGRVASEGGAVAVGGAGGEETEVEGYGIGSDDQGVGVVGYDHGVREAEKRNESENASELDFPVQIVVMLG